ncbi:class I SAM-dependent methyltransferase [soil metagenome]|jgi:SAM-dependent methyltransferase|nr:class I SAM-dependent methyltransferase [Acidobacteriota bacterium]
MKTVERFSNRVENYVKYRPDYPQEVLDLFRNEMNLQKSSVIADIGSGTGISAKLFLENGNTVCGVEPNEVMRRAAEKFLQDFPNFKSINGTAENMTLEASSVDFVIAAQAFHWFDKAKTGNEFRRILHDEGFVALIWNERQLDTTAFLRDYEKLLIEFGTDYQKVRHDNITKESLWDFFQTDFRQAVFQNSQLLDFDGLKGRILSASYMPSAENPCFEEMLIKLKSLFAEHAENGKIEILYDTKVFYGQI